MLDVCETVQVEFQVNNDPVRLTVSPRVTLLDVLRNDLELTGAKLGCGEGECGACSVLLDGRVVNSCLVLAVECSGSQILTVEGLALPSPSSDKAAMGGRELHPIQKAFVNHGAIQCGFCTPGMILATYALLQTNRHPTESDIKRALEGNLCRCTGYRKIIDAVLSLSGSDGERDRGVSGGSSND